MLLCGDKVITIVHVKNPGDYAVTVHTGCSWRREQKSENSGTNVMPKDVFHVRIPYDELAHVAKGDIVILGDDGETISATDSIGEIRRRCADSFVVSGVNENFSCSPTIRHIHVTG